MARGNTYHCSVCGKTYEYCAACELVPNTILDNGFCCKEHYEIFEILSKNGCGLATADETLKALAKYNTEGLAPSIKAHIDSLKPIKVEKEPVEEKTFKKK